MPAPVRRNAIADDALLSGKEALDSGLTENSVVDIYIYIYI